MSKTKVPALHRETLRRLSNLMWLIIEDGHYSSVMEIEALSLVYELNSALVYGSVGYDVGVCLAPVSFSIKNFHTDMVEELITDLGPENIFPLRMMLARQAAADVDNTMYSNDYRLEGREVLAEIIASMRHDALGDDETEDEDDEQQFERSTNGIDKS